jgi:signal transduction histidine kinase
LERKSTPGAEKDRLHLCIEDNGIGMDSDVISAGLGLPGMRERVLSSGGMFNIDGACHDGGRKGTCIEAMFVIDTE